MIEVNNAYKETEIGLIPEDWSLLKLGDSAILKARIGWQGLTTNEYLKVGDYCLVTGTDFVDGYIDWDNCVFVEKERYIQDKYIQVKPDDILVTKDGTIGKVAFADKVDKPTTLNSGVFVLRPIRNSFVPKYLYHILMSDYFKVFLGKLTAGSTISHLYQKDFIHYSFPLPPTIKEQEAIANALSAMDNIITNIDTLIIKKKAIKKGAMQQLLTGETRLKGFGYNNKYKQTEIGVIPEDWRVYKLGDVGDVKMCKRIFSYQTTKNGDIPFYKIGTFGKEPDAYIDKDLYKEFRRKYPFPKKGYLLISASGTIGRTVEYNGEDAYYQDSNIIWLDNDENIITNEYLKYTLEVIKYNTEGSTIKRLYNSIIKSSIFVIPPTLKEQEAIATILSDMDKEIEALEVKKEKYIQLKKGLAQELLTGKTRLV